MGQAVKEFEFFERKLMERGYTSAMISEVLNDCKHHKRVQHISDVVASRRPSVRCNDTDIWCILPWSSRDVSHMVKGTFKQFSHLLFSIFHLPVNVRVVHSVRKNI